MKIKKIGHCCLVIEEQNARIITDPGAWTTEQNKEQDIDAILITHEHSDHLHIESLKAILKNNPHAKIYTGKGAGKILAVAGIKYELLEHGQSAVINGVSVTGLGRKHAVIYPAIPQVDNCGYLIGGRFFYPGDALTVPEKPVEILALPVAGPWLKISEAIDYAKNVKPKICFPVHDGMLRITTAFYSHPKRFLAPAGIEFKELSQGGKLLF